MLQFIKNLIDYLSSIKFALIYNKGGSLSFLYMNKDINNDIKNLAYDVFYTRDADTKGNNIDVYTTVCLLVQ